MGARAGTVRQKRRNTLSSVFWSGCRAVAEFICQSHHLHHQGLIQNTFELRSIHTAKIRNQKKWTKWGRRFAPTAFLLRNPISFSGGEREFLLQFFLVDTRKNPRRQIVDTSCSRRKPTICSNPSVFLNFAQQNLRCLLDKVRMYFADNPNDQ